MEKCKFGFGDWSFLRISGESFTQINCKKISRRFKWKRNADFIQKIPLTPLLRGSRLTQTQLFTTELEGINFKIKPISS